MADSAMPKAVSDALSRLYEPAAAKAWLVGINPLLGDRRPVDVLAAGQIDEVLRALRTESVDAFA